jgi:hypothetical protein
MANVWILSPSVAKVFTICGTVSEFAFEIQIPAFSSTLTTYFGVVVIG